MTTHFLHNEDGSHTLIVGPSGQPKSMLADLTPSEQTALNEWSAAQTGDPERGGVIDLMQWPGWAGVLDRRFKELASENRKPVAQDEYHKTGVDNPMLKFDIRTGKFTE